MLLLSSGLFSWGSVNKDRFIARVGVCRLFIQTHPCAIGICGKDWRSRSTHFPNTGSPAGSWILCGLYNQDFIINQT